MDLIHPLLRIDTILDSSAGAQWLSILDLKAGRENSAFRLDSGLWQFSDAFRTRQCTSNLGTSPGTSDAWSNRERCADIVDGIIVLKALEQFRLMEEVFNRLKTTGSKCNHTKYELFCQETNFL